MSGAAGAKVVPIKLGRPAEHYPLDPNFERGVAALLCSDPKFFGRSVADVALGQVVDDGSFPTPAARTLVKGAKVVFAETKRAPSPLIVLQRLRRMHDDGKLTWEDLVAANDYFEDAESAGLPDRESAFQQFKVPIKQALAREGTLKSAASIASLDVDAPMKLFRRLQALDDVDHDALAPIGFGFDDAGAIGAAFQGLKRLPTGIPPVDAALRGGFAKGQLHLYLAGTNVGKGQALLHTGAEALYAGKFVLHATLEDPMALVFSRYIANLAGLPADSVLASMGSAAAMLQAKLPHLGRLRVAYFEPMVTPFKRIVQWVEDEEQRAGRPVDLLTVDIADRVKPPGKADWEGKTYQAFEALYAEIASYALAEDGKGHPGGPIWCATGSQTKRSSSSSGKSKSPPGTDDVADSMHKTRIAGTVVSGAYVDGDEKAGVEPGNIWHIAKNRMGPRGYTSDVTPFDLDCARIVYVHHR